jgi:hypothetical protein
MHAIKKCLKKRGNFMPIVCTFGIGDKSEKKRLFSLTADSPQTIGFSGVLSRVLFTGAGTQDH